MANISRVLGIDFGESKIGLAIADWETKMAFTFGALKNDREFFSKIKEICHKEEIGIVIIGSASHKMNPNGAEKTRIFGSKIKSETGIEIEYEEEMFTTKMAQNNLLEKGEKGFSARDDAESARIILQSWLDRKIIK